MDDGRVCSHGVADSRTFVASDVACVYGDADRVKQRDSSSAICAISVTWAPSRGMDECVRAPMNTMPTMSGLILTVGLLLSDATTFAAADVEEGLWLYHPFKG